MSAIAQNRCAAWRASIVAMVMAILLLAGGQNALAVCIFNNQVADATLVMSDRFPVHISTAVGGTIGDYPFDVSGQASGVCDANGGHEVATLTTSLQAVPGMVGVYQTNVPGIGVKITETTYSDIPMDDRFGYLRSYPPFASLGISWNSFRISFIVTGPISPGRLRLPSPLIELYTSDSRTALVKQVLYARILTSGETKITNNSCTVNNPHIVVGLPTIGSSSLNFVGDTARTTPFDIALTCHATVNVDFRIDGTGDLDVDATTGVLANSTNTGSATGVGVQIRWGRRKFDSVAPPRSGPIVLGEVQRQFLNISLTDQLFENIQIPFEARYYRTSGTMTPGNVSAQATFTLDYW